MKGEDHLRSINKNTITIDDIIGWSLRWRERVRVRVIVVMIGGVIMRKYLQQGLNISLHLRVQ